MVDKKKQFSILATLLVISSNFIPFVVCHGIIPADVSKLNQWITENVKEFAAQNAANGQNGSGLDAVLATAEASPQVITVNQRGPGDFKTITDAVKSIPPENTKRVIIKIGPGEYKEKITIDPSRKFVTFFGDPSIPKIMYDASAAQYGTVNSSTVAVEGDYFMAVNIEFVNSCPPPDAKRFDQQAVALRVTGDKAAFHNCRFIGFQDTLCDFIGRHLFKDCYIEGTVDFIFGDGQSIYLNSTIKSVATGLSVITAHARQEVSGASGFAFVHCKIIGSGDTYLGRAWKFSPRVIFAYTFMGEHINDIGWLNGMTGEPTKNDKQVFYGEYQCSGPGAETTGRAKFAKILTDEEVQPFLSLNYLNGTSWVLHPPKV
ncbi:pectinesterase PPME1-like [Mangifera indica]|uniref:pectinesterase PPME1-like n=1 Tax=Mangifera indica TaxID=29780 RepID=UPI001CFBA286|nr:pectinesterase PPME1-like [Mangifera indica]XP_044462672.1 pectinesterase PPME1-like [Mangifera indica]